MSHGPDSDGSREVAITGVGAVTPHGIGVDLLWEGLRDGRVRTRPITGWDARGHGSQMACTVPDGVDPHLPRRLVRQTDPYTRFALVAAAEALVHAGLLPAPPSADAVRAPVEGVDAQRVAVIIGSGAGGVQEFEQQAARHLTDGPDRVRPYLSIAMPANMAAGQIAIRHGLQGRAGGVVSACASGADAIGTALDLLRAGRADVVVAGGAEASVTPLMMAAYDRAGALSRRNDDPSTASRPFDPDRDGFVAGEGAGVLVLETAAHALARGAAVHGWVCGYGATDDAHDPTQPAPGGSGAARAMSLALEDARIGIDDVDHVNAHGTSTPLNDAAEAAAIRSVFGRQAPAVTSTKSTIGHLMGAAGAVEAIATVLALDHGVVPPTAGTQQVDPAAHVDLVTEHRPVARTYAVSNSFGFGGHNAVLVLRATSGR